MKKFKLTILSKILLLIILVSLVQLFLINMNGINYILNITLYIILYLITTKIIFRKEFK